VTADPDGPLLITFRKNFVFKKIALATSIALLATSAFAAEPSRVYAGADIGRTTSNDYVDHFNSFGGFAGYRLNDTFALEGGVRRVGSQGGLKIEQAAISVLATEYMVGEFSNFGFFARLGYNHFDAHGCDGILCGRGSINRPLVGVGMVYNTTERLTTRIEVQRFNGATRNLSVGLIYSF
jgi:hypothetical protein